MASFEQRWNSLLGIGDENRLGNRFFGNGAHSEEKNVIEVESLELAIGVDGGGSKTVAWLGRAADVAHAGNVSPEVIGVGASGPSNQRAVGFEMATRNIRDAINVSFERAGLSPRCLQRACLCLAGAGRAEERAKITEWAVDHEIARFVQVVHDGEAMLAAAGMESGIALISGTGSLAWGRANGREARCGGWGYLIDDSGSGYAIGSECLAAIARQADRRGPETSLTAAVLEKLGLQQPTQLVDQIYSATPITRQIAEIAPLVFSLADSDPVARQIVDRAAESLADSVKSVWAQLASNDSDGRDDAFDLTLGGSVLRNQHAFRAAVAERIRRSGINLRGTVVIDQPVQGALNLAYSR